MTLRRQEANCEVAPFSLFIMDVDHFKGFNDLHGHQAGDEMLRAVARISRGTLCEVDLVTRYGGEETAVLLHGMELNHAQAVAEHVRLAVAENTYSFREAELRVRVSFGVAEVMPTDDADGLVHRADAALYAAKKSGRSCSSRMMERHVVRSKPIQWWGRSEFLCNRATAL